jgi:hypothetical protein
MIIISFQNSGGELDRRVARDPTEACVLMVQMLRDTGAIHPGDRVIVTEDDEDG